MRVIPFPRAVRLAAGLPEVCRFGLATRGTSKLQPADVEEALQRGINYLNWCGRPDGLSQAVAGLGKLRERVVVAVQFRSRTARGAAREFERLLKQLRTDYLDVVTFYYVESGQEWSRLMAPGGAWDYLQRQKEQGRLRLIGLTSHQRRLAARWAAGGALDLLMIRYNAAHRGAEQDVFPATRARGVPVVSFTALRWGALLKRTPEDPPEARPPSPADCYRFCLAQPAIAVVLAAPANRRELDHDLTLLERWSAPSPAELDRLREHGDRVRRHGGPFP
jgi:predicted aldo/keto reductase-like oxidoreductase